jgi:hypothetical protein
MDHYVIQSMLLENDVLAITHTALDEEGSVQTLYDCIFWTPRQLSLLPSSTASTSAPASSLSSIEGCGTFLWQEEKLAGVLVRALGADLLEVRCHSAEAYWPRVIYRLKDRTLCTLVATLPDFVTRVEGKNRTDVLDGEREIVLSQWSSILISCDAQRLMITTSTVPCYSIVYSLAAIFNTPVLTASAATPTLPPSPKAASSTQLGLTIPTLPSDAPSSINTSSANPRNLSGCVAPHPRANLPRSLPISPDHCIPFQTDDMEPSPTQPDYTLVRLALFMLVSVRSFSSDCL